MIELPTSSPILAYRTIAYHRAAGGLLVDQRWCRNLELLLFHLLTMATSYISRMNTVGASF